MENVKLNTIEEAIEDFKAGNFVIVVDDEDRENEGDLIIAAEKITPEKVNFMLKHARVYFVLQLQFRVARNWICRIRYRIILLYWVLPLR